MTKERGELFVITGPIFEGEKIERLNAHVFIPTHVFKAVFDPARNEGAAWIAPNTDGDAYQVISIAALEKRIGINLFPKVAESIKEKIMDLPEPRLRGRKHHF